MVGLKQAVAAIILGCMLAACSGKAPPLPPDAPQMILPEEYSFGDTIRGRDWHATRQVLDALEERFGKKSMRIEFRNLPNTVDAATIKAHYQAELPDWKDLDVGKDIWNQSWSFGLVSPDGARAIAIVALIPDNVVNTNQVPLNILTNLEKPKRQ